MEKSMISKLMVLIISPLWDCGNIWKGPKKDQTFLKTERIKGTNISYKKSTTNFTSDESFKFSKMK